MSFIFSDGSKSFLRIRGIEVKSLAKEVGADINIRYDPRARKYGKFPVGHPQVYVGNECPKDVTNIDVVII